VTGAPTTGADIRGGRGKPLFFRLTAVTVALVATVALAVGATAGARSAATLAGRPNVETARLDVAYYRCLTAQARSLVRPGQTVDVSMANVANWVTLSKAVVGWTPVTLYPNQAVAVLTMQPRHGPGSCLGSVVVAYYRDGRVRQGTGGSLPGDEQPPSTPL